MIRRFLTAIGVCCISFIMLEGVCSALFAIHSLLAPKTGRTLAGASIRFDSELGWSGVPNFYQPNYYAPGVGLRTNSSGFRGDREFTTKAPAGRVRVICSGDSQTFGDGVGNGHTWCQVLESLNPRLETLNMAETGYGVDQMYLSYKRNAAAMDHDVQLLAVITDNFRRMQVDNMGGYGKPVLTLRNGEIAIDRTAVGRRSAVHFWALKPNPLREFRSITLASDLATSIVTRRRHPFSYGPNADQAATIGKVLDDLNTLNHAKHSVLVVVYLPTKPADYDPGGPSEPWRKFMLAECSKRRIPFVDLIGGFQKLPVTMKDGMYISPGATHYFAEVPGHFDDEGHYYVAQGVYSRLTSMPELAARLSSTIDSLMTLGEAQ
jgi:hypothetical protein